MRGVVAAGHPVTAEAGADALRAGGNAVDAALAAMFASFVCEPMLTGLGAGGYMLVAPPGAEPVLLDFFVEAPGRGPEGATSRRSARSMSTSATRSRRSTSAPRRRARTAPGGRRGRGRALCAAPARRARRAGGGAGPRGGRRQRAAGVPARHPRADQEATAESRALYMPQGRPLGVGEVHRDPALADALERLGAEGPAPFYTGDVAAAVCAWVADRGGLLTREDLAAYAPSPRAGARRATAGRR